MKMLTVSLLVCVMAALSRATDNQHNNSAVPVEGASTNIFVARGTCLAGWTNINGRCFKFVTQQMSWAQAERNCQSMDANLASIHSFEEYNRVQELTDSNKPRTWIGGSDCQESGAWLWIDGKPWSYTFWCPEQPDNTREECCLQMNTDGSCWDDKNCASHLTSICVKEL